MAYIQTTRYSVMDGEPQLGYMYESELIADDEEIADILVDKIIDDGLSCTMEHSEHKTVTTYDDYSEEEIEIDTADFLDIKALEGWYDSMTEEEAEAWDGKQEVMKEIDLYAVLGMLRPLSRKRYAEYKNDIEKVLSK